jgi:hypothetical protein
MQFVNKTMRTTIAIAGMFLAFGQLAALAQVAPSPSPLPLPRSTGIVSLTPQWSELTVLQQQSLQPLATSWDTLANGHRKKWLVLAKNYPTMPAAEQTKLHSRMAEWAALTPRERELARLNFAETKKSPTPDRAANWETYKALTPEERKALASTAASKPAGAAVAIKPAAAGKLAPIPVTRHTAPQIRLQENAKGTIDRNTLLPIAPAARSN